MKLKANELSPNQLIVIPNRFGPLTTTHRVISIEATGTDHLTIHTIHNGANHMITRHPEALVQLHQN